MRNRRIVICIALTLLLGRCSCQQEPPPTSPPPEIAQNNPVTAPPQSLTAPPQSITAPPQAITAPPQSLTAPPQSLTAPPRGFSTLTGKLSLPPDLAASKLITDGGPLLLQSLLIQPAHAALTTDLFNQLKIQINGKDPETFILEDKKIETDGSLSAQYFVPNVSAEGTPEVSLVTIDEGSVLLRAHVPVLEDAAVTAQDLDTHSTAIALLKEEKPELSVADIRESTELDTIETNVKQVLSTEEKPNVKTNSGLRTKVRSVSKNIQTRQVQSSEITVTPSELTIEAGQVKQLTALVKFSDGHSSSLVLWASADPRVALVSANGLVGGVNVGQTTLIVHSIADLNRSLTIPVTVQKAANPVPSPTSVPTTAPSPTSVPTTASSPTSVPTTSAFTVTTVAGTGFPAFRDGPGSQAEFNRPKGISLDIQTGNFFIADSLNHVIRVLAVNGTVSTFIGSPGQAGPGANPPPPGITPLNTPSGVLSSGPFVFVADTGNNSVLRVNKSDRKSIGIAGFINAPRGIAIDSIGNLYIAEVLNNAIQKQPVQGQMFTLTNAFSFLNRPQFLTLDPSENIIVTDGFNHCIKRVNAQTGDTKVLAGVCGTSGFQDGSFSSALFNSPSGIAMDSQQNLYIADMNNHRIRKISATGTVSTLAGTGQPGEQDGPGNQATLTTPTGLALDNNEDFLYFTEIDGHRIRKIALK